MGRGKTGILLALEPEGGPDEGDAYGDDDWGGSDPDGDEAEDRAHARPARDPQALIGGIERNLSELRQMIAEMDG